MVLLQLDMQTLLISVQRVCRDWHTFISHSSAMQQALFLAPSHPGRKAHELLQRPKSIAVMEMPSKRGDYPDGAWRHPYMLRIMSADYENYLTKHRVRNMDSRTVASCHLFLQCYAQPMALLWRMEKWMIPEATWRRMLIQQNPPIRYIGVHVHVLDDWTKRMILTTKLYDVFTADGTGQAAAAGGLTMGEHFDIGKRLHLAGTCHWMMMRFKRDFNRVEHCRWMYDYDDASTDSQPDDDDDGHVPNHDKLPSNAVPKFEQMRSRLLESADVIYEFKIYARGQQGYSTSDVRLFQSTQASDETGGEIEELGLVDSCTHTHVLPA